MTPPRVRAHGMLFTDELVRALLEGRKTVTRRPVTRHTSRIVGDARWEWFDLETAEVDSLAAFTSCLRALKSNAPAGECSACTGLIQPQWWEGEVIWGREAHQFESNLGIDDVGEYPPPFNDGRPIRWVHDPEWGRFWTQPHYRATDPRPDLVDMDGDIEVDRAKWRPSIHMPRWASRLLLSVVNVRPERLQDITVQEIALEGAGVLGDATTKIRAFAELWDQMYASKGHGWDQNRWVWRIEVSLSGGPS